MNYSYITISLKYINLNNIKTNIATTFIIVCPVMSIIYFFKPSFMVRWTWPTAVGIKNSTFVITDHLDVQRITFFLHQYDSPYWSCLFLQDNQRTINNTNKFLKTVFNLDSLPLFFIHMKPNYNCMLQFQQQLLDNFTKQLTDPFPILKKLAILSWLPSVPYDTIFF